MKTKRILSILLALCMLISVVNIPVLASVDAPTDAEQSYLVDGFTARPKINLSYMQPDPTASGIAYKKVPRPTEMNVGDTFYVGVEYENFQQYKEVGTNGNGLFSFSCGLLFDTSVLVPEATFLAENGVGDDDWMGQVTGEDLKDVIQSRINVAGSYFYKTGLQYPGFAINPVMFKDPVAGKEQGIENAKIIGIAAAFDSTSKTPTWKDDTFITAVYEFKVKAKPDAGTKVLDVSRQPNDLTISFGVGGTSADYKYGNGYANDLKGFTDIDISEVVLFPDTYTVEFYNEKDGTKLEGKDLEIEEGKSAKDLSLSLPAESDLTAPSGQIFTEFRYDDPNEADENLKPKTFTENTKLDANMLVAGEKVLKVYAHYEDGHTVTFNSNTASITGADDTKDVTVKKTNPSAIHISKKPTIGTAEDNPAPDFVAPSGYSFKEWNTQADGKGTKLIFEDDGVTGTPVYTADGDPGNIDTVYAIWEEVLSITYNPNGGTNDASVTNPVVGKANEVYTDPAEPTRTSTNGTYKFVGWNTKQNGSGTMIKADGTSTYGNLFSSMADAPNITLYAQWAAVTDPGPVASDAPTDPDPDNKGVKVTFDSNASGNLTGETVTEPKLKYYYPVYGDSLGALPEEPTRTNYLFKEWNTKPDGSGTAVTASTVFDTDTLGDDLKEIAGTNISYEITVYAVWDLDTENVDPADQITIKFNSNKDGTGASSDDYKTIQIFKGDSIGYDITAPDNSPSEFVGWFEGDNSTGKVVFGTEKYSPTAKIETNKTFYAKWQKLLIVIPQSISTAAVKDGDSDTSISISYTGEVIKPKYNVYIAEKNAEGTDYVPTTEIIAENVDFTEADSPYQASYMKDGDSSPSDLKEIGTYGISVTLKSGSELKEQGAKIVKIAPNAIDITPALLTVKVDPETQKQKSGAAQKADITVEGVQTADSGKTVYEINYYLWTDSGDKDGLIQDNELGSPIDTPTATGTYVVKVENLDSNYEIDDVVSTSDNTHVLFYGQTADSGYPGYPGVFDDNGQLVNIGHNIAYIIQPNDPSASDISIKGVKPNPDGGDPIETPVDLKENDYSTDKPLVKYDETASTHSDDYWARVDKDTESVKIEVTPEHPDGVTVTVKVGDVEITPNADGSYNVPLTNTGKDTTDISITLSAGSAPDQKTQEYIVHVQKPGDGSIVLNYGNSPYGEIMKADNIPADKKDAAKQIFDANNQFGQEADEVPDAAKDMHIAGSMNRVVYRPEVWDVADIDNMDRNETAIFVYNGQVFRDPGFVAKDSIGNPVDDSKITRTIKVNRMNVGGIKGCADVTDPDAADAVDTKSLLTYVGGDNNMLFTDITSDDAAMKLIRPGVYDMEYKFTDEVTNETVTTIRKVIVLFRTGDTDMDKIISAIDLNAVKLAVATNKTTIDGAPDITNNLYLHRMMDTDNSGDISAIDINAVKLSVATNTALPDYYISLPTE